MKLSEAVVRELVQTHGWPADVAENCVENACICVVGVAWEDLPGVLAALLKDLEDCKRGL